MDGIRRCSLSGELSIGELQQGQCRVKVWSDGILVGGGVIGLNNNPAPDPVRGPETDVPYRRLGMWSARGRQFRTGYGIASARPDRADADKEVLRESRWRAATVFLGTH